MSIFFKDGGFYLDQFNDSIPVGAVEITQETYDAMFAGQAAGQMIFIGEDGGPALMDKPLPSREVMVEIAEQNRQSLIDSAMQSVSVIQLKLQAGRTLTDTENARLNSVLDYIDAVNAIDTSIAPDDINWPEMPASA